MTMRISDGSFMIGKTILDVAVRLAGLLFATMAATFRLPFLDVRTIVVADGDDNLELDGVM
jgi:hypothetical protein